MGADDSETMANELQGLLGDGGFDPFSLFQGDRFFHSVFLAPLTAGLSEAIERFRSTGEGPLARLLATRPDGTTPSEEERQHLRALLEHTTGLVVVVVHDEQRFLPATHFHAGIFDERHRAAIAADLAEDVANPGDLGPTLDAFGTRLANAAGFPAAYAAVEETEGDLDYWSWLADGLLGCLEGGIMPGIRDQQGLLLHYAADALGRCLDPEEDGDALLAQARCHLLADEVGPGLAAADRLLAGFEPLDEECLKLLDEAVAASIRNRCPKRALELFTKRRGTIDAVLGGVYEAAQAEFRAAAAAQVAPERLLAAAERLHRADKRAFRHELNREAIWRVALEDPGPCLEVDEAADRLERSLNFVAKRVEAGTIPWVGRGDDGQDVAIPAAALEAWRRVMETYGLLD